MSAELAGEGTPDSGRIEYVYLIGSEASPLVKIGRTIHVAKRLAQIQNKSPVRLSVLWQVEGDAELEFGLHRLFKPYRCHGEWFDFPDCDPVAVVKEAVMLGLHEAGSGLDELTVQPSPPELPPLKEGDVVRIVSDFPGPRYGVIQGVTLRPVTHEISSYELGGTGKPRRTFNFPPSELEPAPSHISRSYAQGLWEKNPPKLVDLISRKPRRNDEENDESRMT